VARLLLALLLLPLLRLVDAFSFQLCWSCKPWLALLLLLPHISQQLLCWIKRFLLDLHWLLLLLLLDLWLLLLLAHVLQKCFCRVYSYCGSIPGWHLLLMLLIITHLLPVLRFLLYRNQGRHYCLSLCYCCCCALLVFIFQGLILTVWHCWLSVLLLLHWGPHRLAAACSLAPGDEVAAGY
jgi:hypothetical protein